MFLIRPELHIKKGDIKGVFERGLHQGVIDHAVAKKRWRQDATNEDFFFHGLRILLTITGQNFFGRNLRFPSKGFLCFLGNDSAEMGWRVVGKLNN